MKELTKIVSAGRHPEDHFGVVNPPVFRASTVTFPTLDAWDEARANRFDGIIYGRFGTPTTRAFEEAVAILEGADKAVSVPSGMGACTSAIMSVVSAGDHMLVQDSAYQPVRNLSNMILSRYGVEITYFDSALGADVAGLIQPNTKLIYLESPGSQTFEMPDIPAITAVARERGIMTAMDNTWATSFFCKPLELGVDLSINAATKYLVGHSDAMLGVISMRQELYENVKITANFLGGGPGSEEAYLGLRGIRTLGVRLPQHQINATKIATWLQTRPEVHQVLYPALPDHPGHDIWLRDFKGATGLMSVLLNPFERNAVASMVDGLEHFLLGASFGGYESLILPFDPSNYRTATEWNPPGPCLRLHVGLEDTDDLIEDLERGFARLTAAG